MPYYASGQLRGLVSGLPGAAEYEALLARPGKGTASVDAQIMAYLTIIALIVFSNLAYLNARSEATYEQ